MLTFHSARTHNKGFDLRTVREYHEDVGDTRVVPEGIGRVIRL